MNYSENTVVGSIVAADYRTASIFRSHQVDFCCGGQSTLLDACQKAGASVDDLLNDLSALSETDKGEDMAALLPLHDLCDHIVNTHHRYVRKQIPELLHYLEKISNVHGEHHPELHEVFGLFRESANNLMNHMEKEEIVLFPAIRMLSANQANRAEVRLSDPALLGPVSVMEKEHEAEGNRFRLISALTNNYKVPEDGCSTYRVAMEMLRDFESDLHRHIHLENNILFPGALELSKA